MYNMKPTEYRQEKLKEGLIISSYKTSISKVSFIRKKSDTTQNYHFSGEAI
jgi:hypothetical protein